MSSYVVYSVIEFANEVVKSTTIFSDKNAAMDYAINLVAKEECIGEADQEAVRKIIEEEGYFEGTGKHVVFLAESDLILDAEEVGHSNDENSDVLHTAQPAEKPQAHFKFPLVAGTSTVVPLHALCGPDFVRIKDSDNKDYLHVPRWVEETKGQVLLRASIIAEILNKKFGFY